jgi:hypothetical protein
MHSDMRLCNLEFLEKALITTFKEQQQHYQEFIINPITDKGNIFDTHAKLFIILKLTKVNKKSVSLIIGFVKLFDSVQVKIR